MKSTEERIQQLEKELQALKEETKRHSGKETEYSCNNKDCAQSNKFSVGDWVIVPVDFQDNDWLIRITQFNKSSVHGYGFNMGNGSLGDNGPMCNYDEIERKATPEEVEKALRKEWARRCKEAGWDDPDKAEIEEHAYEEYGDISANCGIFSPIYHDSSDWLWTRNGIVYSNGKWATPKPKKANKFFGWEIKRTKGRHWRGFEYDKDYKIGCQVFTAEFLADVEQAISHLDPERTIGELQDELHKLDL